MPESPKVRTFSQVALGVALLLAGAGLLHAWVSPAVVVQDTDNYIINGLRGTAIVCAGIVFGVISLILAIYDLREVLKK